MTNDNLPRGWSRRSVLRGATALGAAGMAGSLPMVGRAFAQDNALSFWQFYAPGGDVKTQVDWFVKMVEDWNAGNDPKVNLEYVVGSEYISGTKLATSFASGQGPDIFIISPGDFLRYYNGGVLADLTPHIEEAAQKDFPQSVIANRMVDGKIYGVPMEVEPMAFYYSVKAFEDAELGTSFCLMLLDIDHFKRFNDTWGHQTGDQVLRLVAMTLKSNIKGKDLAARYGGEEFAAILPETDLEGAVIVADNIRKAVQAKELLKRSTNEKLGRITASFGVAMYKPGDSPSSLIERADRCLYAAKHAGRNRVLSEVELKPDDRIAAA